jgi:hypothetical protein
MRMRIKTTENTEKADDLCGWNFLKSIHFINVTIERLRALL